MAEQIYSNSVIENNRGINLDVHPSKQPRGTRRYTLNAVEETSDGQQGSISNEFSTEIVSSFPIGYIPIGRRYLTDNNTAVILYNSDTDRTDIGLINRNDEYVSFVNTGTLTNKITNQCDIRFRVRRGNERVIYWVDALNNARTFNYDRVYNFYTISYKDYLKSGGDPNTYVGDKWDRASFDLIKSYSSVPTFNDITIIEYGDILPGSYNFAIQLVDEDLNPTEWITTSNTVNIFNDSTNSPFEKIRGSRNVQTDSQSFPRASKSIKLLIGNLDTSFPYYRVAIIRAAGNNGIPDKVLASDLYSTFDSNFIYSGNDGNLTEVAIDDILIDKDVIFSPHHIEQTENRLELAYTLGKGINWCNFQKYATSIKSDICYKDTILNSVLSDVNVKNAKSTFLYRGYMPGEVYSFGIVYLFDDGYLSPVFHIPGKNTVDTVSKMKYNEINTKYIDTHNCTNDYWGKDASGETLEGKPIRHHRFPFRKEVNKPLVTRNTNSTDITRYKLTVTITLNPAHTPSSTYPVDGDGNPLVIPYTFAYKVISQPTNGSYNGSLVDTDVTLPRTITIYDDTQPLSHISGSNYLELTTSTLSTYMTGTNDTFIITENYAPYVLTSITNTDEAEIFGIEFSRIEKPHPNVVGFYIVRNERTDDDRMILDNALIGPNTSYQQYKSFGLLTPKQYYHVSGCNGEADSGKTLGFDDKSVWFFNPEFQFFQKKIDFDAIEVEGKYTTTSVNLPTISDVDNSACNSGGGKGIYINDVQAGTSYNPDVNKKKDKDDDGFDLLVAYKNSNMVFSIENTYTFPAKDKVYYINAAAYQNYNFNTYYNTSIDNKIGMYISGNTIDTSILTNGGNNRILYASLTKANDTAYSNFVNRPYFKEHNNPILFGDKLFIDNFQVFNGDAEISSLNLVSSVFYDMVVADRAKKTSVWKIIIGSVLIVAGIALAVFSGGTSLALSVAAVTALTSAAISYGVSLISSGIKFDQFQAMVQTDYEQGLKETVTDGVVFECLREQIENEDDTIRWFADRVSSLYIESSVPFGLRSGLTCGVPDFIDSPANYDENAFRSYLTEKLTTIDRNQGSGRLYRGFASSEIYDMNLDYLRFNKQKEFFHLALEYDCCSDFKEINPTRVRWSEQSFQEEKVDNYRSFLPNNYVDIEGIHGEITNMYRLGNSLFIHTKEGLWQLPKNNQERVTDELVSFLGTGDFFSILPMLVVDDDNGSAGTSHKWASVKTPMGVFFISESDGTIYLHSGKIKDIGEEGLRNYFKEKLTSNLYNQLYTSFGIVFPNYNNPANPNGTGYTSIYDDRYNRVIFTKRDYSILADKLSVLQIVNTQPIVNDGVFRYNTDDATFYLGITKLQLDNDLYFENKSITISYSLHSNSWCSWHSYLPNDYIPKQNGFYSYSYILGQNKLWKHNSESSFQTFYGVYYPHIIEQVKVANPLVDTNIEAISLLTIARTYDIVTKQFLESRYITFNKIILYTERQCSGEYGIFIKDANADTTLSRQTLDIAGVIMAIRTNRDWFLDEFRDYVVDYTEPMFTSDWQSIKNNYPIDKIVNQNVVSFNKNWYELETFRDKYIVFRLKFDNFDRVNLITHFTVTTEQNSGR